MDSGTVPSGASTVPAGSGGYDMGARRYGPDLGAFLQQDLYNGALADLGQRGTRNGRRHGGTGR